MTFRTVLTSVLSLFFGLLYPAYGSINAIESVSGGDDTQWLVYWLIFSLVSITESLLWPALKWLPLYQEVKIVVLAWLVLPQTKGATWVYEAGIHPAWQFIRKELSKNPSIKNVLDKAGTPADLPSGKSWSLVESEAHLEDVVRDVKASLKEQISKVEATTDPSAKTKAIKDYERSLAKFRKLQKTA